MSSILAFSATHIAWLTKSAETKNLAYVHAGVALSGLQEAIGNFSRENSDAVLASSILLAWQASDWFVERLPIFRITETDQYSKVRMDFINAWDVDCEFRHSYSAWSPSDVLQIINLMSTWKHASQFSTFLSDHPKFFSPNSAVLPIDDQSLTMAIHSLSQLAARLPSVHPLAQRLQEILRFASDFQYCSKSMQSDQMFEKLQPLRNWLFWMPVSLVKANDMSSSAMILLAQLYNLALGIDASLPELSGAALGSLTVQAIEQLDSKLCSKMNMALPGEMSPADLSNLMHFPRMTVTQTRLEEAIGHETISARAERQGSPYSFHRLSMGSQPGTPNYPPPGSPGMLQPWQNPSLDDLSIPPSPFLNYGAPVSRRHSGYLEMSPLPSEHSFDNRSLSAYDIKGESPAYSPAAYSPAFLPELPDDGIWDFDVNQNSFTGV